MKKSTENPEGTTPVAVPAVISPPGYQIVGLQPAERMPIQFAGREYDLVSLTADEAAYLLQYPEAVPYLKKLDVSSAND